ncbi:hypothetical protein KI387_020873, partial [Taxus chinensis]
IVQLKINKFSQGLVTLDDILSTDDQLRKDKTKMSTHADNNEEISIDEGKKLFLIK